VSAINLPEFRRAHTSTSKTVRVDFEELEDPTSDPYAMLFTVRSPALTLTLIPWFPPHPLSLQKPAAEHGSVPVKTEHFGLQYHDGYGGG
jgi:hypothetical protein